jgi:hypothetical protein
VCEVREVRGEMKKVREMKKLREMKKEVRKKGRRDVKENVVRNYHQKRNEKQMCVVVRENHFVRKEEKFFVS